MDAAKTTALIDRGKTAHRQGKLDEAARIYQQVLDMAPESADALHLLGVIANQREDYAKAALLIGEALKRKPEAEHFHCNFAIAKMGLGDWEAAHRAFQSELARYPASHASHANLGVLLQKQGRPELAIEHYQAALSQKPDDVVALNNLGFSHVKLRQFDVAREIGEHSLRIRSDNPDALNLLGLVSRYEGDPERALDYCGRALRLKPASVEAYQNSGLAHRDLGELDKAMADFEEALRLKPDYPDAHFCRGLLLLANAEFEAGWREYEYGLLCGERLPACRDYPRWQGEPIGERTLLVCAEQGLGDEIMFASVLPEIVQEAGHCVVECDARLVPIYERSFPSASVIQCRKPGETGLGEILPPIDVQCPVGSLPLYRRKQLEDFPRHSGYLKADPERVAYWKTKLGEMGPGLKVGISWRGGVPKTGMDRRSIPLEDWLPILGQKGVQFVSLQYTECQAEITDFERSNGLRLTHWQEAIDNYEETAALVCALDLVITVQTAIFHLAGALGRPVWGLLPIPSEWRYGREGVTLPWYPTARLFRQMVPGDWSRVMKEVGDAQREEVQRMEKLSCPDLFELS